MNVYTLWRSVFVVGTRNFRSFASAATPSTSVTEPVEKELTTPKPQPGSKSADALIYDEKTHTGQAYDDEDYRLARFTYKEKQVNPNVAMRLIADIPPQAVKERVVACDGGGGALGHPKIYINLDKPGNHACGYCGLRFYNEHVAHNGTEHIQV